MSTTKRIIQADFLETENGVVTVPNATVTLASDSPATGSVNGLMISSDKSKLDAIAANATQNSTDGFLRDRANQTGVHTSLPVGESNTPDAPILGLTAYSKSLAGRQMLAIIGKSGLDYTLQSHIGRNKIALWQANGDATSFTAIGGIFAVAGAAVSRVVSIASFFTWFRRLGVSTTNIEGMSSGLRTARLQYGRGNIAGVGGFHFICRFGISDAAAVATGRLFIGLVTTQAVLGNINPSTFLNCVGIGADDTDTNLHLISNDATATASKIDLGIDFPANTRNTDMFELIMFCPPNGSSIQYTVTNLTTGVVTSGTYEGKIPASTTLMAIQAWRNNGDTALVASLDIVNIYCETDN